jgi:excisionase family DNA binding protein
VNGLAHQDYISKENQASPLPSTMGDGHSAAIGRPANVASRHAATGEERSNDTCLLTVHEVAELLQVPVSWVYGRTRKRCTARLPGIRLGKYWRFREKEIHDWIETQRGANHAA